MTNIDPSTTLSDAVPTESKYLKKEDVGEAGQNLTIDRLAREDLGDDGYKTVIHFKENVKPMVLNVTNRNRLQKIFGDSVASCLHQQVNVYEDPMVDFGGKVVGGIRLRPVAKPAAPEAPAAPNDDIPF